METSVAKRPRLEPQNAEKIIQEQKQVIENQKARIQQLEEQLKTSESSATETIIKTIPVLKVFLALPVPELPNEIWLEIMSYLSTYDVLKNVARVSKRFHKLSEDPYIITKIEVDSVQFWPENKEEKYGSVQSATLENPVHRAEKYCNDFLEVLKRSLKLRGKAFTS